MPRRTATVKEEPSAGAPTALSDITTPATAPNSMLPEASPGQPRNRRFARSDAPSVETGLAHRVAARGMDRSGDGACSTRGSSGGVDDADDGVLMLEVKPQSFGNSVMGRFNQINGAAHPSHQTAPNISFVNHGFTAIGDKVKEHNDTLGELQSLGIQHVASLPELVLVGDQSAGKSSLMSSFSGIYLPRSEGACTRCPVHIRLSGSQDGTPWSCRISLQQDYEYRPPASVTRAHPFGPWFEKRRDVKDFANLVDPSKIEDTLRWAQIATLNPNSDHSLFKPGTGEVWRRYHPLDSSAGGTGSAGGAGSNSNGNSSGSSNGNGNSNNAPDGPFRNEAAFSPNTVAVDISAPDLADLSFYDLPGVFTSAKRDEDQYLVKVVENLTAKYISHQQAIILWAVPMNADPETSSTFSVIRAQKAQARTIGIMTKADLLPPNPSATTQWVAMLRGEQHVVGHGYFMTARPIVTHDLIPDEMVTTSQRDPTRPADELERQSAFEEAFFNKQLPGLANQEWRECFHEFEHRCGVSRLVSFMSQQLGHEFAKYLPQIKEKVAAKLLDVNYELAQLPDMPENPELEIRRSLAEFATQVRLTLEGPSLLPLVTEIMHQFQHEIEGLKPRYVVKVDPSEATGAATDSTATNGNHSTASSHIDLTRDSDDVASIHGAASPRPAPVQTPTGRPRGQRRLHTDYLDGQRDVGGPNTPSKRVRGGDGTTNDIKIETASEHSFSPGSTNGRILFQGGLPQQQRRVAFRPRAPGRDLAMVRTIINAKSKPGMPNIVSEDVYTFLCMEAVQPWNAPLLHLIDRTHRLLDTRLHDLLCVALSTLRERRIFKAASALLKQFLHDRIAAVKATLLAHYNLETRQFFTLNKESLLHYEEDEARVLTRRRHHFRMVAYLGEARAGKGGTAERLLPRDWDTLAEEERARDKATMNQEMAKLGPDPYSKELSVCAYVRGYYRTASLRFVDTCTLHINSGLLPDVVETLSKWYLDTQLGVFDRTTPQTFLDLMGEEPATAAKRASLKEDRQRFERTMESIQRLEASSQDVHMDDPQSI